MALRFLLSMLAMMAVGIYALTNMVEAKTLENHNRAERFVADIGQQAASLSTAKTPEAERARRVHAFVRRSLDVAAIGRFTLGRYWPKASKAVRARYLDAYEGFVVRVFSRRLVQFAGRPMKVKRSRELKSPAQGVRDILVIARVQNVAVDIGWRVRQTPDRVKIVDLMVAGISMAAMQRADFSAVLRRNGGNVEMLIDFLRLNGISDGNALAARN